MINLTTSSLPLASNAVFSFMEDGTYRISVQSSRKSAMPEQQGYLPVDVWVELPLAESSSPASGAAEMPDAGLSESEWNRLWRFLASTSARDLAMGGLASLAGVRWPHNRRTEPLELYLKPRTCLEKMPGIGRKKIRVIEQCAVAALKYLELGGDPAADDCEDVKARLVNGGVKSALSLACAAAHLDQREQEALSWRYGLDGGRPETLEEIATIWSVSRERVRQIEKHAKDRLRRHPGLLPVLEQGLGCLENAVLDALFTRGRILPFDDLGAARRRLPGDLRLLVDLCCSSLSGWLDARCIALASAWVRLPARQDSGSPAFPIPPEAPRHS